MALTSAKAQLPRHTLRVGYGIGSVQGVFYGFLKGLFSQVDWQRDRGKDVGPITFLYSYAPHQRVEIGLAAAYTTLAQEGRRYKPTSGGSPSAPPVDYEKVIAGERVRYYTITPQVTVNWKREEKFVLYSSAAVGKSIVVKEGWHEEEPSYRNTHGNLAFHINLIGFQYGKKVCAFGELGVGFYGTLQGGVALRL
ncbi:hypothetical protein [Rufibacter immobilis]|uniref:hypothetical protein n=1 Tax=Rufibacter immobilis TaxID=1348778 RepID=UPI0011CD4B6E|nr:hypothetical protein [Rufibacter immobilis]